jgi:hypothetical protein
VTPPTVDRRAEERGLRAYRLLLRLYPRRFRQEYGDDLLLLLRDQLADEPAGRVYTRAALDLVLTVPSRHLETRMKRPPSVLVPMIFTLVALGWFMMLGVGGSSVVASLAFALPGLAAAVLAAVSWRRARSVVSGSAQRWWQFLLAGAGVLGGLTVVTTITGELPENRWFVAMAGIFTGLGLCAAGVVLGVLRLLDRGRPSAA